MTSTNRIECQELEDRRLHAAELFAAGVRQAEVAHQLGVTRQSVNCWHARFEQAGAQALRSRSPTGYRARLSDADLERLTDLLLQGATAHGFTGELWTVARITQLIAREFDVAYHPSHLLWRRPALLPHPGRQLRHRRPSSMCWVSCAASWAVRRPPFSRTSLLVSFTNLSRQFGIHRGNVLIEPYEVVVPSSDTGHSPSSLRIV